MDQAGVRAPAGEPHLERVDEQLRAHVRGHRPADDLSRVRVLDRKFSAEPDYSDEIAREIDDEIRRIAESAHVQARPAPGTLRCSAAP